MPLRFLSLLFAVLIVCGCASVSDFDFDKPLIPIPENTPEKPKEDGVWIETKTSRVWVNPHVDENGELVEGHFKHIVLEPGRWAVKANEGK